MAPPLHQIGHGVGDAVKGVGSATDDVTGGITHGTSEAIGGVGNIASKAVGGVGGLASDVVGGVGSTASRWVRHLDLDLDIDLDLMPCNICWQRRDFLWPESPRPQHPPLSELEFELKGCNYNGNSPPLNLHAPHFMH